MCRRGHVGGQHQVREQAIAEVRLAIEVMEQMVDGSGVLEWKLEVQQNRGCEEPISREGRPRRPSVDLKEPGLGLGEHGGSEPGPSVARRRIGVHTDRCRGDRVGDGRMQRAFRIVEFVAGTAREPLVELRHEAEHAPGRGPLRLGR